MQALRDQESGKSRKKLIIAQCCLVFFMLLDICALAINAEFHILGDSIRLQLIVRTFMKAMQVNISFILFLWTIYVCRDLKKSLQG